MTRFWFSLRYFGTLVSEILVADLIIVSLFILYYYNQMDTDYILLVILCGITVFAVTTPIIVARLILFSPVTLSRQGIKSSITRKCSWSDIQSVKVKKPFLFAKYIYLYNGSRKKFDDLQFTHDQFNVTFP